jgi:hypothetical protein
VQFLRARFDEDDERAGLLLSVSADKGHPQRLLADVDAKRRILDECAYWHEKLAQAATEPTSRPYPCLGEILDVVTPILRALSLPYADHPGYREEWRP